ncbi:hypothetical protein B0H14DRAFT_3161173 [Mycena olivaceomarginata]|nr:hypothetical protein B0H14DRAFT_3161173 [Mycena olivaceomarginata]
MASLRSRIKKGSRRTEKGRCVRDEGLQGDARRVEHQIRAMRQQFRIAINPRLLDSTQLALELTVYNGSIGRRATTVAYRFSCSCPAGVLAPTTSSAGPRSNTAENGLLATGTERAALSDSAQPTRERSSFSLSDHDYGRRELRGSIQIELRGSAELCSSRQPPEMPELRGSALGISSACFFALVSKVNHEKLFLSCVMVHYNHIIVDPPEYRISEEHTRISLEALPKLVNSKFLPAPLVYDIGDNGDDEH